ncbi:MAG: type II secretion system protein M [Sedimentisphaerales bacterium]|nr:type II secretion system protein M [Sedimentisphaerales bacterium]
MRLTRREKHLSFTVAAFVAAWILYAFLAGPALARIKTLQRVIPENTAALRDLRTKSDEYLALRERFNTVQRQIAEQPEDFNLMAFLEKLTEQCQLTDHILSMKQQSQQLDELYTENIVIIEFQDVTFERLVIDLLAKLDSAPAPLRIKTLNIVKTTSSNGLINASIHITNLCPN